MPERYKAERSLNLREQRTRGCETQEQECDLLGKILSKINPQMRIAIPFFFILFFLCGSLHAQSYSIVIKNGRVIDPKNNIDAVMDIAITLDPKAVLH